MCPRGTIKAIVNGQGFRKMTKSKKIPRRKGSAKPAPTTNVRSRKTQTPKQSYRTSQSKMSTVRAICGITDPFCGHAIGAKLPSSTSIRTVPYTIHLFQNITATAGGDASVLVFPAYGLYPIKLADTITSTVATFTSDFTAYTPMTQVWKYHNISYGVRIRNTTAPLNAGGMIRVRTYGDINTAAFLAIDRASYLCDSYLDIPLQDAKDVAIIGRKVGPESDLFQPVTSSYVVNGQPVTKWGPIVIDLAGAPAGASFTVELYLHQEYVMDDTSGTQMFATVPPPSNPVVRAAQQKITSSGKTIFQSGMESASRFVESAAMSAITGLVEAALIL